VTTRGETIAFEALAWDTTYKQRTVLRLYDFHENMTLVENGRYYRNTSQRESTSD